VDFHPKTTWEQGCCWFQVRRRLGRSVAPCLPLPTASSFPLTSHAPALGLEARPLPTPAMPQPAPAVGTEHPPLSRSRQPARPSPGPSARSSAARPTRVRAARRRRGGARPSPPAQGCRAAAEAAGGPPPMGAVGPVDPPRGGSGPAALVTARHGGTAGQADARSGPTGSGHGPGLSRARTIGPGPTGLTGSGQPSRAQAIGPGPGCSILSRPLHL
jgi:hypothetical protein